MAKRTVKQYIAMEEPKEFNETLAGTYQAVGTLELRHGAGTRSQMLAVLPAMAVKCKGRFTREAGVRWLYVEAIEKNSRYCGFCAAGKLKKI